MIVVQASNFVVDDPSDEVRGLLQAILRLDFLPEISDAIRVLDPNAQLAVPVTSPLVVLDMEHVKVDVLRLWDWQSRH